jgi:hypothetical protein
MTSQTGYTKFLTDPISSQILAVKSRGDAAAASIAATERLLDALSDAPAALFRTVRPSSGST